LHLLLHSIQLDDLIDFFFVSRSRRILENKTCVCKRSEFHSPVFDFIPLKFILFDRVSVSPRTTRGILIETFLCRILTAITEARDPQISHLVSSAKTDTKNLPTTMRRWVEGRATPCLPTGSLIRRVAWLARNAE
jgi:hypothetical protein